MRVAVVSYCDQSLTEQRRRFIEFHESNPVIASVTVYDAEPGLGRPSNSVKIMAVRELLSSDVILHHDYIILCDIDTRVWSLGHIENLVADLNLYTRAFYPLNLQVLSGFLILRCENYRALRWLLSTWADQYESDLVRWGWYADQVALSKVVVAADNKISVASLSRLATKRHFKWAPRPGFFVNAWSHKGLDFWVSNYTYKRNALFLVMDCMLVPLNRARDFVSKILRAR